MANIDFTDLLPDVLPHLAGDPSDPVTEAAIKRAAIDFCADSWIWQVLPDPMAVTSGQASYTFAPPAMADISAVLSAELAGVPLAARTVGWLNTNSPRWRTDAETPKFFTQLESATIILAPLPDITVASGLTATIALQPAHDATGLPAWIVGQYRYDIANGAIARLMLMADKPWTDLRNGGARLQEFQQATAQARESAVSALGSAPLRSTPQH